ncbi:helix-turn-helix domain-containing protein [Romboutsia lituseburensis]|uniref:helix-turn-helix domain-containing protein n=1 Tax=Romboutsia lituseburensis TaxID=1537 RepID=UPI0022EA2EA3|nr:helix-turn-helix domain-containing protein [Romboutsia lituseburensis]
MAKLIDGIDFNLIENDAIVYENTSLQSFGYGIISKYVVAMKGLSLQAKGVYSYLIAYAGNDKQTYPSQSRMCDELGIKKVDTLRKYIKELQMHGLIKVYKTKKGNIHYKNVYVIADDTRTIEVWKKEYLEDTGIKEIVINKIDEKPKKEKPVIKENDEMTFEEITEENQSHKSYYLSELRDSDDYKKIFNQKMETSHVFINANNSTKDLILAQELKKLGYNIIF